jgi:hypothetical protein
MDAGINMDKGQTSFLCLPLKKVQPRAGGDIMWHCVAHVIESGDMLEYQP